MRHKIFLLSNNKNLSASIESIIGDEYSISVVNKSALMVELYKINPTMLIVDIDGFEEGTLNLVESIVSVEYLPTIYVYSQENKLMNSLKNQVSIPIYELKDKLNYLIKQASIFKVKYDGVTESYDAIEILNGEVKDSFKKYIGLKSANSHAMIKELFDLVIADNLFLTNKPEVIWAIFSKDNFYEGHMYKLIRCRYAHISYAEFEKENSFKFDIYAGTGFSKNFNVEEVSDINYSRNNLPKAIINEMKEINNFAGYSIGELTVIGMNYNKAVSKYDIAIIKALTINFDLMDTIKHQMNELEEAFDYTTNALARAAEANDDMTGKHIKRVNSFAKILSQELDLDREFVNKIYVAAQMHDVGKIYVDKKILTKPGKLTEDEFKQMQQHPIYGEKIIGDSKYLKMAAEIARNHHEKYDGTGYPDGKKGEEIPVSARIVFLADIYDALRSARPYKPGFSHQQAYDIITVGDGRVNPENFDPKVLEAFIKIHLKFETVYELLKD